FDDVTWSEPVISPAANWNFTPLTTAAPKHFALRPKLMAKGELTGPFDGASPPNWPADGDVSWYKRNLHPGHSPTGVWRRYDLGKVRLGYPCFVLNLPAGAIVEFAYSESLSDKPIFDGYTHKVVADFAEPDWAREPRVAPYIPLSGGLSRNLDHYVARGGIQE